MLKTSALHFFAKKIIPVSLLAFVSLLTVQGCKGSGDVKKEDQTVQGIDLNHDGIRDEIYEKIHQEFKNVRADEIKVLEQYARLFQEINEMDFSDRLAVLLARGHLDEAANCGILVFGDGYQYDNFSVMLTKTRQWYFNTTDRKIKQREFILRAKEYHYQPMSLEGVNTCDFELSPETIKIIELRKEFAAKKKAKETENEKSDSTLNSSPNKSLDQNNNKEELEKNKIDSNGTTKTLPDSKSVKN